MVRRSPFSSCNRRSLPTAFCLLPTVFLLLLTAHCSLLTVCAQSGTATLSGTVEDQNGAVVPGASVTVSNTSTSLERRVSTNDQGYFTVPLLPPSTYTVRAEHHGFAPVQIEKVILNVGDQKALQIQLKAGDINATVQVTNDAPLINESPAVGTVVDRQFVENIPLNGRSFQSLLTLTPGVVLTKTSQVEQGQFSVNGQRADANYITVDGVSANVGASSAPAMGQSGAGSLPAFSAAGGTSSLVSVDALQEFKIQTSTYAPEFGRTPGGQVQILTRSGTNKFQGTVFEYFRNDALDANDWFANSQRLRKPPLRQNDFGGTFSGPILLPRFGEGGRQPGYNGRNRTFFFFSYEGLRLRQPVTAVSSTPSLASRQLAAAQVPQILPFLNAYPMPNGTDLGNNLAQFNASYSDPQTLNATSIRVDHTLSERLTLFGRYNYSPSDTAQRGIGGLSLSTLTIAQQNVQTLTLGTTWTRSPEVSNDFRFNWSRNVADGHITMDSFGGAVPLTDQVFPSPFSSRNAQFGFFITGASTLRLGKNATNVQRQINIVENLSVVSGSHQLKFGVDYRRLSPTSGINEYFQAPSFSSVNQSLTGTPSSVIIQATEPGLFSFTNLSPYAQDTWKVGRRLTLTYGLRWEYNPPPSVGNGPGIVTVQGLANPSTISLAPQGTPPFKTTYANFAPRVGVAYQLSRKQGKQMMLRGGFGIFYDLGVGNIVNAINQSFPYSRSKSISNVSFPLTPGQAAPPPLTLTLPTTTIIFGFDPTLKLPRTYQWNLAVEQSLGTRQTVSASYVGAAGRRLLRLERLGRPNPNFSTVQEINNLDTSDYHAMQLQYNRRLSRGLQALASYTWSHSIDTASADTTLNTPDQRTDPRSDRGPSDFDVRHSFNAAVTYKFPAPASRAVERAILGNWSIDSIFTLRSATPVDVRYGRDIGFGFFQLRPDIVQGIPLYLNDPNAPGGKRFNNTPNPNNPNQKGPFLIPIDARQGTLGRNSLRGFPAKQVDLAIRRQFNISEGVRFQLKAEFFNVFNHPNFADPFFFLTSGLFGQSTQMLGRSLGSGGSNGGLNPLYQIGGPRSIQLALRLQF